MAWFEKEYKLSHLSTGEKSWYSGDRCDCCNRGDGGERYDLYAHQEGNAEVVSFSICVDCVYYINYGRLDDATMLELEQTASSTSSFLSLSNRA